MSCYNTVMRILDKLSGNKLGANWHIIYNCFDLIQIAKVNYIY